MSRGDVVHDALGDRLVGIGWDAGWAAALADASVRPGARPGRVVRRHKGGLDVVTATGVLAAETDPSADLEVATGDWVAVAQDADGLSWVLVVLPRRTALVRRDPAERAHRQILAANADEVWVVHGLDRPLNPRRLERALVLAFDSGADPAIVLTKADTVRELDRVLEEVGSVAAGVPVLPVAAAREEGVAALRMRLGTDRTAALLGESGAGKSTLVNRLAEAAVLLTGAVRAGDAKGRHTTTVRALVPLTGGGAVLDTPGVRAMGLWELGPGLDRAFPEIAEAEARCRFRDCGHGDEPGCAVRSALSEGSLRADRVAAWHRLLDELDAVERERTEQGRRA